MDSTFDVPVSNNLEMLSSSGTVSEKTSSLYVCYVCGKMFLEKFNLKRHMTYHKKKESFCCGSCGKFFSREDDLRYHMIGLSCSKCCEIFCTKSELKDHTEEKHVSTSEDQQVPYPNPYSDQVKHHNRKNALNVFSTATFDCCEDNLCDILAFLDSLRSSIEYELKYQLHEKKGFKWSLMLDVFLTPTFQDELSECFTLSLDSNTVSIFNEDEISECIDTAFREIMIKFEDFFELEMFWTFTKIIKLDVLTAKYNPF